MLFLSAPSIQNKIKSVKLPLLTVALAAVCSFGFAAGATALGTTNASPTSATTTPSTANEAKLKQIIAKGNTEITRRLTILNSLSSKISGATKLTSSDQAALSSEVTSEISGLTTLKAHLDADTTASAATTDASSIFSEYRVFALVYPKVELVRTADNQEGAESQLSTLLTGLEGRLTTSSSTSSQNELNDMKTQLANAQTISSSIENAVINLQPSDYNTNHAVLSGDLAELKTAQNAIKTAETDAQSIISSLKG